MTKSISGILLKAEDGAEPMPIPVTDHKSIHEYVGGWFDCVQTTYKAEQFMAETDDEFIAVGYVHDEGAINGMPLNKMATLMFHREVYGDVVVVSGTSPKGVYDGDNYDVPVWFSDAVFSGSLRSTVDELDSQAHFLKDALLRAVREGLLENDLAANLVVAMGEADQLDEESLGMVEMILDTVGKYHAARLAGMPAFSKELLDRASDIADMMMAVDEWEVTDEAIAEFLSESDGE